MTHSIKKGQTHALSLCCIFIPSLLPSIIFVSPCGSLGHSLQHASAWFLSHVVLLRRALQYDLHHSESFRHLFIKYSVLLCFPVILVSRRHLLPEALRHSRQHAFHHTRLYSVTNSNMQLAMLHSLRSLHVAEFHAGRNSNHVRFYCQYLFVTVSFFRHLLSESCRCPFSSCLPSHTMSLLRAFQHALHQLSLRLSFSSVQAFIHHHCAFMSLRT